MSQAERQKFIRQTAALFVACHHEKPNLDRAVELAKILWQRLEQPDDANSKRGRATKPRELEQDYYQLLNDRQRQAFDAFWGAFAFKQGRNGAAMRWYQLGDVNDAEYQHIINAAKAEAGKTLPQGQGRKMAQGWIGERRWLDHVEPSSPSAPQDRARAAEYTKLQHDLLHAKRMSELLAGSEGEFWQAEVGKAQAKIEALRTQ